MAARVANLSALISFSFLLVVHFSGVGSFFAKGAFSAFSSVLELVFICLAVYFTREKEYQGFISFKLALRAALTFVLINALLLAFLQYIYLQFLDIHFAQNYMESMEKFTTGLSADQQTADKLQEVKDKFLETYSPISMAWSSFYSTVALETFIALFIAFLLRREPPFDRAVNTDENGQDAEPNT